MMIGAAIMEAVRVIFETVFSIWQWVRYAVAMT
jgi:hypothetical protein